MSKRLLDPSSSPAFLLTQFEKVGREPDMWHTSAYGLKHAADAVLAKIKADMTALASGKPSAKHFRKLPVVYAYMLLAGLAIENLIKGLSIKKDSALIDNGKLDQSLGKHDLLALARKAGVRLTEEERSLVERLTEYVIWAGRYPIPKRSDSYLLRGAGGSGSAPTVYWTRNDPVLINRLYKRLTKKF